MPLPGSAEARHRSPCPPPLTICLSTDFDARPIRPRIPAGIVLEALDVSPVCCAVCQPCISDWNRESDEVSLLSFVCEVFISQSSEDSEII